MAEHVYVDEVFDWPGEVAPDARKHGTRWCHMWCDEGHEAELHVMAERIGLRREWFQRNRVCDHYDLTPRKRNQALLAGVKPMSFRAWLTERMKARRAAEQGNL